MIFNLSFYLLVPIYHMDLRIFIHLHGAWVDPGGGRHRPHKEKIIFRPFVQPVLYGRHSPLPLNDQKSARKSIH